MKAPKIRGETARSRINTGFVYALTVKSKEVETGKN